MKSFLRFLLFVLVLALAVSVFYIQRNRKSAGHSTNWRPEKFTPADAPKLGEGDLEILSKLDSEYKKLSSVVIPSVVSITTSKRIDVQQPLDPLEYFFGRRRQGRSRQQVQSSLGSGFIVSKEGHVVTNNHVIENMDEIQVQLADGRTAPAKILGADPQTDLAVLKIELPNISPLALGNSDEVQVGQLVFAIGNPYGLQESVSQGIISAKGRKATSDSLIEAFQTDAAVNRGNSGGPLVNIRGEVIGVNSSIFSESGGNQGIAFAIPSNTVKNTVESVISRGKVVRGYLGVTMQVVSPELASQVGATGMEGVMVEEVVDGSPADLGGIQPGDIIKKFNGKEIADPVSLRNNVAQVAIDSTVELAVVRNNQEKKLKVKIVEQPENYGALASRQQRRQTPTIPGLRGNPTQPTPNVPAPAQALAGIEVGETENGAPGVLVVAVDETTPAGRKLQAGDVIQEINRSRITSVDEYRALVSTLNPDANQVLLVVRGRQKSFVVIPAK